MTFLITSIPHENYRHFRSDEKCHRDDILMSFDDIFDYHPRRQFLTEVIALLCTSRCSGIV